MMLGRGPVSGPCFSPFNWKCPKSYPSLSRFSPLCIRTNCTLLLNRARCRSRKLLLYVSHLWNSELPRSELCVAFAVLSLNFSEVVLHMVFPVVFTVRNFNAR